MVVMLEQFYRKKTNAKEDLFELDDPDTLLRKEGYDDCFSCRVLGKTISKTGKNSI